MSDEQKTILLVDDDPDVVEAARVVLESVGFRVEWAEDGASGVARARELRPDLIILDVMMATESDGFHAAYEFWKDPATASAPILMVSAIGEKLGIDFSNETDTEFLPVDGFLAKPVEPQELIANARRFTAQV